MLRLQREGVEACLATILVGDDQASATYVKKKHEACAEVGINATDHRLGAGVGQDELNALIEKLNSDARVHGDTAPAPPARTLGRVRGDIEDIAGKRTSTGSAYPTWAASRRGRLDTCRAPRLRLCTCLTTSR